MKVKRTLTVEFDLSVKEQIEMLASLSEFENMAKENGMQVSGSFSGGIAMAILNLRGR